MRVEILSTGNELIRGNSIDTNAAWLSSELTAYGLQVRWHTTVGDDLGALVDAIRIACSRANAVILTGGLGPTEDDLTREAAAKAFGVSLVYRASAFEEIKRRFKKFRIPMAQANKRQAFFPKGAKEIGNPVGTAPGFRMEFDGAQFFAVPGVPREMRAMFEDVVSELPVGERPDILEIRTFGLPEGDVDEIVSPLVKKADDVSYGLTVSGGTVNIILRKEGAQKKLRDQLKKKLGPAFLGEGPVTLQDAVADLLKKRRATIAIAESFTGGLVASRLIAVPGISEFLLEGLVTYSNESKIERLGVPAKVIKKHGAVSEECAVVMAEGAAKTSGAKVGVASTGIAGPAGGTKKKPVGLVYVAVSYNGKTKVAHRVLPGSREHIRERGTNMALNLTRLTLMK